MAQRKINTMKRITFSTISASHSYIFLRKKGSPKLSFAGMLVPFKLLILVSLFLVPECMAQVITPTFNTADCTIELDVTGTTSVTQIQYVINVYNECNDGCLNFIHNSSGSGFEVDNALFIQNNGELIIDLNTPGDFMVALNYSICSSCLAPGLTFDIGTPPLTLDLPSLEYQGIGCSLNNTIDLSIFENTQSNVSLVYKCTGGTNGPFNFSFDFSIDPSSCWTGIDNLGDWQYAVIPDGDFNGSCQDFCNYSGTTWGSASNAMPVILNTNDYLVFRYCEDVPCCNEININEPSPSDCSALVCGIETNLVYRLGCPPPVDCTTSSGCEEEVNITLHNDTERDLTIQRVLPAYTGTNLDEFACLTLDTEDDGLQWEYVIRNDNLPGNNAIDDFYVVLYERPQNSLTSVYDVNVNFATTSNGIGLNPDYWTCPSSLEMQNAPNCNQYNKYVFHIPSLLAGEFFTLSFRTKRCPIRDDLGCSALDFQHCDPIYGNKWQIRAYSHCDDDCFNNNLNPNLNNTTCNCQDYTFQNAACAHGNAHNPNLLDVTYSDANNNPIVLSNGNPSPFRASVGGGTAGPVDDINFDLIPLTLPTNIFGDWCWMGSKDVQTYRIQIDGDAHDPISVDDLDLFDSANDATENLLRVRINFSDGLTLNSCPTIESIVPGPTLNPIRIGRRELFDYENCVDCVSSMGTIDESCNTTCNNFPGGGCDQSSNGCSPGQNCDINNPNACPVSCEGYGKSWDIYYRISNNGTIDPAMISELESLMQGILEFEIIADCGCIPNQQTEGLLRPFQVQFDFTTFINDGNLCEYNPTGLPGSFVDPLNMTMFELDALPWIALSQIGDPVVGNTPECNGGLNINVQCPGCVTPGIIASNYIMQRQTFGFCDVDNDGEADGMSPYSSCQANYTLGRSMHGDIVEDSMDAIFTNGTVITYQDMIDENCSPHPFQSLQLDRTMSLKEDMGLRLISCQLEIIRGASTILTRNYDNTSTPSLAEIVTEDCDSYFYTFNIGSNTLNGELGNIDATSILYNFDVGDEFRLICQYEVCGNISLPNVSPTDHSLNDVLHEMNIDNLMWFSGQAQPMGLWSIDDHPFPCRDLSLPNCDWLNNCIYFCEPTQGRHHFVSVGTHTWFDGTLNELPCTSTGNNICAFGECNRNLGVRAFSYIGNGGTNDLFLNEIRVPPLELKSVNTTDYLPDDWVVRDVRVRTESDACLDQAIQATSSPNNVYDVNLNLSCPNSMSMDTHQYADNITETHVNIIYEPSGQVPCNILTQNNFPDLSSPTAPIFEFGLVDQADCGSPNPTINCGDCLDCGPPILLTTCNPQIHTGVHANIDQQYTVQGIQTDIALDFINDEVGPIKDNEVCWNFTSNRTVFIVDLPSNLDCLEGWSVRDSNGSLVSALNVNGDLDVVLPNLTDSYSLCADLTCCDSPISFILGYGEQCGCLDPSMVCFTEVPLKYNIANLNLGTSTMSFNPTIANCNPAAFDLEISIPVSSGGFIPQTINIPTIPNIVVPTGFVNSVSIDGNIVSGLEVCLTSSSPSWVFELRESPGCVGGILNTMVACNSIEIKIQFQAECSGTFSFSPTIEGIRSCGVGDPIDPITLSGDLMVTGCLPCAAVENCNLIYNDNESATNHGIAYDIISTGNNSQLIIGSIADGNGSPDSYAVESNGTLPILNSNHYDFGDNSDEYRGLYADANGEYLLTGFMENATKREIVASKLNTNLGEVWSIEYDICRDLQNFGAPCNDYGDYLAFDICEGLNPNVTSPSLILGRAPYISGNGHVPNSKSDIFLMEIDENGIEQQALRTGTNVGIEEGRSIITVGAEYVIAGHRAKGPNTDIYIQRVIHDNSNNQNLLVTKRDLYELLPASRQFARSIVHEPNVGTGKLYVAGAVRIAGTDWDAFVMCIDNSTRDVDWSLRYFRGNNHMDYLDFTSDLIINSDGDLIVVGHSANGSNIFGHVTEIETSTGTPSINWSKETSASLESASFTSVVEISPFVYEIVGQSTNGINGANNGSEILSIRLDMSTGSTNNCCLAIAGYGSENYIDSQHNRNHLDKLFSDPNFEVTEINHAEKSDLGNLQEVCQPPVPAYSSIANESIDNEDFDGNFDLDLFPNPVSETLTVITSSEINFISLSDAAGKVYDIQEFIPGDRIEIDVSSLSSGIYLLTVLNRKGDQETKQFVKE